MPLVLIALWTLAFIPRDLWRVGSRDLCTDFLIVMINVKYLFLLL